MSRVFDLDSDLLKDPSMSNCQSKTWKPRGRRQGDPCAFESVLC